MPTKYHHHHHHVPEGLGMFPVPWSSRWSWSLHLFFGRPMFRRPFGLYRSACFGILFLSILCTCCSHFFWYCFISFTMFYAPVFPLIHWFFSLSKCHMDGKVKNNKMGGACGMYGGEENCIQNFSWGNLRERDHLEDLRVDGKNNVEWIFQEICLAVHSGFSRLRIVTGGGLLWKRQWIFGVP